MKQIKNSFAIAAVIILQSCSTVLLVAPVRETYPQKLLNWSSSKAKADTIKFVRIGHATTLITVGNKIILTDPWFSEKKDSTTVNRLPFHKTNFQNFQW